MISSIEKFWNIIKYYTSIPWKNIINTSDPQMFFFVFTEGKAYSLLSRGLPLKPSQNISISIPFSASIFFSWCFQMQFMDTSFLRLLYFVFHFWKLLWSDLILSLSLCSDYCPIRCFWFRWILRCWFCSLLLRASPSSNRLPSSCLALNGKQSFKNQQTKAVAELKIKPEK